MSPPSPPDRALLPGGGRYRQRSSCDLAFVAGGVRTAMSAEQVGAEAARLCEQGRFPEALRVANDAISENQEGATLHLVRGDILQRWGRCREGLAELLVAESLGLRTSDLYLRLGQVGLAVGRAAEA